MQSHISSTEDKEPVYETRKLVILNKVVISLACFFGPLLVGRLMRTPPSNPPTKLVDRVSLSCEL